MCVCLSVCLSACLCVRMCVSVCVRVVCQFLCVVHRTLTCCMYVHSFQCSVYIGIM